LPGKKRNEKGIEKQIAQSEKTRRVLSMVTWVVFYLKILKKTPSESLF